MLGLRAGSNIINRIYASIPEPEKMLRNPYPNPKKMKPAIPVIFRPFRSQRIPEGMAAMLVITIVTML